MRDYMKLAILTEDQVISIRKEYGSGNSTYKLAEKYKVSREKIRQILKRECWKHI